MSECFLYSIKPYIYIMCFSVGIISSEACPNASCISQCLWASRSTNSHSLQSVASICCCWQLW